MPPTTATRDKRLVKRVESAIRNPAITPSQVHSAIKDLQDMGLLLYKEDYLDWIRIAIEVKDCRKLCAVFGYTKRTNSPDAVCLRFLLEKAPSVIVAFVSSPLYRDKEMYDDVIMKCEMFTAAVDLFFRQPKAAPVLLRLCYEGHPTFFRKYERRRYIVLNPVLRRRVHLRKVLLRFWSITVKKNLPLWRETLYFPGTGSLYLKSLTSWNMQPPLPLSEDLSDRS